jgi:hypothetical protein
MGVRDPGLDFGKLKDKDIAAAFSSAIENHYRYYQYYSNTLIAVVAAFLAYVVGTGHIVGWKVWIGSMIIVVVLFFGSRDALTKFFKRAGQILT